MDGRSTKRSILARQWQILRLIGNRRGRTAKELASAVGCSRPTITRDLKCLREDVGIRIHRKRVNGNVRHVLGEVPLAITATPAERAALQLAEHALAGLVGTRAVESLRALGPQDSPQSLRVLQPPSAPVNEAALRALERAIDDGKRVRIHTRIASRGGELRVYVLDPLALRLVEADAYLDGWSVERGALRTFKIARVERVDVLEVAAGSHDDVDLDAVFEGALKTWSGDGTLVRVRIAAEVAWAVREYPLATAQRILKERNGDIVVEAEVAGLVEVSRWVLSWGRHAEALQPGALRERLRDEVLGAAKKYGFGSPMVNRVAEAGGEVAVSDVPVSASKPLKTRR